MTSINLIFVSSIKLASAPNLTNRSIFINSTDIFKLSIIIVLDWILLKQPHTHTHIRNALTLPIIYNYTLTLNLSFLRSSNVYMVCGICIYFQFLFDFFRLIYARRLRCVCKPHTIRSSGDAYSTHTPYMYN